MARRGYTLIEMIVSLMVTAIICLTISVFYKGLGKVNLESNMDLVYCITSLTHDVNTATHVDCTYNQLILETTEDTNSYYLDNGRLVRTPGFNIYLHEVDNVHFKQKGDYIYIIIERNGKSETFEIGTAFRPEARDCDFNRPSDLDESDDYFITDDNDD